MYYHKYLSISKKKRKKEKNPKENDAIATG
jgi:hypothetical protein